VPIERLIDPGEYDPAAIVVSIEELRTVIPQRGNWEQLDGLLALDKQRQLAVGVRRVPEHPFWEADHMPGQPLLPGALMLDALAQLGIYYHYSVRPAGDDRLFGFGGLQDVTFRRPVRPGQTIIYATRLIELRSRRARFHGQGYVDGHCVVDAVVVGVPILPARSG
jgi:3-hydroxyacyl-[acyl-carrier-protein] dehydratase